MQPNYHALEKAAQLCRECEKHGVQAQNAQRGDLLEIEGEYRDLARGVLKKELDQHVVGTPEADFYATLLGLCHFSCSAYGTKRIDEKVAEITEELAKTAHIGVSI